MLDKIWTHRTWYTQHTAKGEEPKKASEVIEKLAKDEDIELEINMTDNDKENMYVLDGMNNAQKLEYLINHGRYEYLKIQGYDNGYKPRGKITSEELVEYFIFCRYGEIKVIKDIESEKEVSIIQKVNGIEQIIFQKSFNEFKDYVLSFQDVKEKVDYINGTLFPISNNLQFIKFIGEDTNAIQNISNNNVKVIYSDKVFYF